MGYAKDPLNDLLYDAIYRLGCTAKLTYIEAECGNGSLYVNVRGECDGIECAVTMKKPLPDSESESGAKEEITHDNYNTDFNPCQDLNKNKAGEI